MLFVLLRFGGGLYREAGLDVTIEPGNGSQTTAQLLAVGKYDIGFADSAPVMRLVSQGAKIKVLATILQGNPNAVTQCTAADFALAQCPADSQVGLVTVYANSEGDPDKLLGTAPIFSMRTEPEQTALFAFITPSLGIPVNIPVAVRTGSDYGLRFTVSEITQSTPLAGADLIFWGVPAEEGLDKERFPKGSAGKPASCLGLADTSCIAKPTESTLPEHPLTDNPTICTGEPLLTSLEVQTYQDPTHKTREEASYPATTGCERPGSSPGNTSSSIERAGSMRPSNTRQRRCSG